VRRFSPHPDKIRHVASLGGSLSRIHGAFGQWHSGFPAFRLRPCDAVSFLRATPYVLKAQVYSSHRIVPSGVDSMISPSLMFSFQSLSAMLTVLLHASLFHTRFYWLFFVDQLYGCLLTSNSPGCSLGPDAFTRNSLVSFTRNKFSKARIFPERCDDPGESSRAASILSPSAKNER